MSKYFKAYEKGKAAWKALTGGSKKSPTITSVKIAPHITTKRNIQDKVVKAVDEGTKEGLQGRTTVPDSIKQSASKWKKDKSKELKDISYKWDKLKKKNLNETKTLLKAAGATSAAGAGAAGVSLYNKKKKKD